MMAVVRSAWLIARKDLVVEARSRELLYTTLFFAVSVVLVFVFALVRGADAIPVDPAVDRMLNAQMAAGLLWVGVAFAGTLALSRTFERERQAETLRALLLAPVEHTAVYLGKLFTLLVLMAGVELLIVPIIGLLFNASLIASPLLLIGLLAAGTIGFASVGTMFAAMLVRASSRDVLLPVLLYPIAVPVVIAGVRGTAALFNPTPDFAMAQMWLAMLVFFDVVFLTLALWTFGPAMSE
jgi:heme exporter protein B